MRIFENEEIHRGLGSPSISEKLVLNYSEKSSYSHFQRSIIKLQLTVLLKDIELSNTYSTVKITVFHLRPGRTCM